MWLLITALALSVFVLREEILILITTEPEMEIHFQSVSVNLGNTPYSIKYVAYEGSTHTVELWQSSKGEDFLVDSCQIEADGNTFSVFDAEDLGDGYDIWEFWISGNSVTGRIGLPLSETAETEAYLTC